jgi:chemotaxis receptor (MCP) glutamine deamidase CheD
LLARIEVLGSSIDDLDARVYGGASVLGRGMQLAEDNVAIAFQWLFDRAVPVVEEDVLGTSARRIHFDVETGVTRMTKVGDR